MKGGFMLALTTKEKETFAHRHARHVDQFSRPDLKINVLSAKSAKRFDTESFIKNGYAKTYQAQINVTTPYLIALEKGALKAALGIRSAKTELFIEQYLDKPIQQVLANRSLPAMRREIAEIAHLYSNAKVFTVPLMLVTAVALHFKSFTTMVFTGTEHVINLIKKTGIHVETLTVADKTRLINSKDKWGTYYDANPVVACISLSDVLTSIRSTPSLLNMFKELNSQVVNVLTQTDAL